MGEVDGCAGSASGASLVELNVASVLESPQVGEEVASGEAEDVTEAGERQLVALGEGAESDHDPESGLGVDDRIQSVVVHSLPDKFAMTAPAPQPAAPPTPMTRAAVAGSALAPITALSAKQIPLTRKAGCIRIPADAR